MNNRYAFSWCAVRRYENAMIEYLYFASINLSMSYFSQHSQRKIFHRWKTLENDEKYRLIDRYYTFAIYPLKKSNNNWNNLSSLSFITCPGWKSMHQNQIMLFDHFFLEKRKNQNEKSKWETCRHVQGSWRYVHSSITMKR